MCEDCDWPAFILCCCEILCLCCTNCADDTSKCSNTQETNFTNPVNPNGTYTAQQPLNQGYNNYPPQQFTSQYSPEQQFPPQQFGAQQNPIIPNSALSPTAPFPEYNYASNPNTPGVPSSNYPAPPPSYAEAVGMESYKAASPNSPDIHTSKA